MNSTKRRTSVYTLTVPAAPAGLLDTMTGMVNKLPHTALTGSTARPHGEVVVNFRCETDDNLATGTANLLLEAGDYTGPATLTIDLGVNKRVVSQQ